MSTRCHAMRACNGVDLLTCDKSFLKARRLGHANIYFSFYVFRDDTRQVALSFFVACGTLKMSHCGSHHHHQQQQRTSTITTTARTKLAWALAFPLNL
eukprot:1161463-Pelagomonas_calceolata.AAC.5